MPIPLGILAVAGAGAAGGGAAFELLETTVLGADVASVSFSSLGTYSAYKHLQVRAVLQDTGGNLLRVTFNSTSGGTDYATHRLQGDGSSVSAQQINLNDTITLASLPTRGNEANTFMGWVVDLLDFSNTNKNKTIKAITGTAQASFRRTGLYTGLWASTAAITTITFAVTSGSITSGSRLSLYGVR